jgi:ferritin-like metal-binding protein YciE
MMSKNRSLHALMLEEMRDLYDAEKQLVKALPKMARGSSSPDLRKAIEGHLVETRGHVQRLERAFQTLGQPAKGKHCAGIAGIIEEGASVLKNGFEGAVLDAGIIAGAQRAEHYETAAYGNVIAWALAMGHEEVASLLHATLQEEKAANDKLTAISRHGVNEEAASGAMAADETGKKQSRSAATSGDRKPNRTKSRRARKQDA